MKDIFTQEVANNLIDRINQLSPNIKPNWSKMSVDQMSAHCNVAYEFVFSPEKFKKPGLLKKFLLRNFVRKFVVGEKPYKMNSRTAPEFLIIKNRDFETEKLLLTENIKKILSLGRKYFEGKENFSFGRLSANEWNVLFYKYPDHHLRQFGV